MLQFKEIHNISLFDNHSSATLRYQHAHSLHFISLLLVK